MTTKEIKDIAEKLGETTNVDINMFEVDAAQKIYDKFELPALFIEGDGEFRQGDATDEEVFEAARNINHILGDVEVNVFYNEGHEWEEQEDELNAEQLYSFLQKEYWKIYEEELMKVVKENWKDFYEEEIIDFLEENFYKEGREIGQDYSVFINVETGHIWEEVHSSSNWMFQYEDENRKRILHMHNYEKPFKDFTDMISENDAKTVSENLGVDLPTDWDEMDYTEQVEWVEKNATYEAEEYDYIVREEAIDRIIDSIEDEN